MNEKNTFERFQRIAKEEAQRVVERKIVYKLEKNYTIFFLQNSKKCKKNQKDRLEN